MTRYLPLLALAACSNLSEPLVVAGNYRDVADVPPEPIRKVDLLFVIDKSGSVANDQDAIAAQSQQALFDVLAQGPAGVLPDLHIAVISTDVGAAPYELNGCHGDGDDGHFLVPGEGGFCQGPDGTFLVDEAGPDGTRTTNYPGTLVDTFGCMVRIGSDGCGFEQPFESVRRALDGRNPDFLRADAMLAVVLVTDEDDCSARDPLLFDPSADLGPLDSFRCFEHGIVCAEGDEDPRAPGPRGGCRSDEESAYVQPVQAMIDFLTGLKSDPTQVMVISITGPDGPVKVGTNASSGDPQVEPSCLRDDTPEGGDASPAIRISQLVDAFPARSSRASICLDTGAALEQGAEAIVDVTTRRGCLLRTPSDADPALDGLQVDCRAFDVSAPLTEAEERTPVPSCAASGGREPCFEIVADPVCDATGSGLLARVRRAATPRDRHFVVNCLL